MKEKERLKSHTTNALFRSQPVLVQGPHWTHQVLAADTQCFPPPHLHSSVPAGEPAGTETQVTDRHAGQNSGAKMASV